MINFPQLLCLIYKSWDEYNVIDLNYDNFIEVFTYARLPDELYLTDDHESSSPSNKKHDGVGMIKLSIL